MDDRVLLGADRDEMARTLQAMRDYLQTELALEFSRKTQIAPIKNGVEYIGFHFYLTDTGRVIRRLTRKTKDRYKHRLRLMKWQYARYLIDYDEVQPVLTSYRAHLFKDDTWNFHKNQMTKFVLRRGEPENGE